MACYGDIFNQSCDSLVADILPVDKYTRLLLPFQMIGFVVVCCCVCS